MNPAWGALHRRLFGRLAGVPIARGQPFEGDRMGSLALQFPFPGLKGSFSHPGNLYNHLFVGRKRFFVLLFRWFP